MNFIKWLLKVFNVKFLVYIRINKMTAEENKDMDFDIDSLYKDAHALKKDPKLSCIFYGPTGAGKTFTALTFPGPIYVINLDKGIRHNMKYVSEQKIVKTIDCLDIEATKDNLTKEDYNPWKINPLGSLKKFEYALLSLQNIHEGTVVIDTMTHVNDWLKMLLNLDYSRTDEKTKKEYISLFDWKYVNEKWSWLWELIKNIDANLVVTAKLTPEYAKDGSIISEVVDLRRGSEYQADIMVKFIKDVAQKEDGSVATRRHINFNKFRGNKMSKNYDIDDLTYDKLAKVVEEENKQID